MVTNRARGVANTATLVQIVGVSIVYWAAVILWEVLVEKQPRNLEQVLFYNEFLVLGLLLGVHAGKRQKYSVETLEPLRSAGKQTMLALFFMFGAALAVGDVTFPRTFFVLFTPLLFLLLWFCNTRLHGILAELFFAPTAAINVLLVGNPDETPDIAEWLASKRRLGFVMAGYVLDTRMEEPPSPAETNWNERGPAGTGVMLQSEARVTRATRPRNSTEYLGTTAELEQVLDNHEIHHVLFLHLVRGLRLLKDVAETCERRGIRFSVVSDLEEQFRHAIHFFDDNGVKLITLRDEPLEDPVARCLKRILDILVSIPVVILVLPAVALVVALLHRLQSPGPLLFRQNRAGLQNRPFTILKFRTMHTNQRDEAKQAHRNDARVFSAGKWLRKLSIDELPQFLNVLSGEMSVVGPRPHLVQHNSLFDKIMNNYHVRSIVKPGLTGLAQVKGLRGETKTEMDIIRRVRADIDYIENWSILLDLIIILKTLRQIFVPPSNAY